MHSEFSAASPYWISWADRTPQPANNSTFEDPDCPRLFSLKARGLVHNAKPSQVLLPNRDGTFFILASPIQIIGHPTIGVFIDGECERNGTPLAKGSFGVYFGQHSCYNLRDKLPADFPLTSQRTELMAAVSALRQIEIVASEDKFLELFSIVTESA